MFAKPQCPSYGDSRLSSWLFQTCAVSELMHTPLALCQICKSWKVITELILILQSSIDLNFAVSSDMRQKILIGINGWLPIGQLAFEEAIPSLRSLTRFDFLTHCLVIMGHLCQCSKVWNFGQRPDHLKCQLRNLHLPFGG